MARTAGSALAGVPHVDLMPPAEVERRERMALVQSWGWRLAVALLIVGLIDGGTYWLGLTQTQRLVAAQARTAELTDEIAGLSEVSGILAEESALRSFRSSAMADAIVWSGVIRSLSGAVPRSVDFVGFDVETGGAIVPGDDAAVGLVGTLQLRADSDELLAPTIRAIRALPGVLAVDGDSLQSTTTAGSDDPAYDYVLSIALDQSVYSGAYADEEAGK